MSRNPQFCSMWVVVWNITMLKFPLRILKMLPNEGNCCYCIFWCFVVFNFVFHRKMPNRFTLKSQPPPLFPKKEKYQRPTTYWRKYGALSWGHASKNPSHLDHPDSTSFHHVKMLWATWPLYTHKLLIPFHFGMCMECFKLWLAKLILYMYIYTYI